MAGCHHLGFELDTIATASTPARRGFFFDSVHVSTYLSGHDAPKTCNATQDGMTGRLQKNALGGQQVNYDATTGKGRRFMCTVFMIPGLTPINPPTYNNWECHPHQ